jgi:hypothetical protein
VHNALVPFLLVPLSVFSLVAFSFGALGCNSAKLTNATGDAGCNAPVLEYPCVLKAAGTPGCNGDVTSTAAFGRDVYLDGSAPVTCTVIVNDLVPDEDGQCAQLGTCACDSTDAGVYGWACRE